MSNELVPLGEFGSGQAWRNKLLNIETEIEVAQVLRQDHTLVLERLCSVLTIKGDCEDALIICGALMKWLLYNHGFFSISPTVGENSLGIVQARMVSKRERIIVPVAQTKDGSRELLAGQGEDQDR